MNKVEKMIQEIIKLRNERTTIDARLSVLEETLVRTKIEGESLWSRKEAADFLRVTVKHVDNMRLSGKLKCKNISGCIRFDPEEVRKLGA